MIPLGDLERHATAYLPDENRRAHPAHVQAYYGHCGPEAMLALIRIARASLAYHTSVQENQKQRAKELHNALKEVE